MINQAQVLEALRDVVIAEVRRDIVSLELVEKVKVVGDNIGVTISIPSAFAEIRDRVEGQVREAVRRLPGVKEVFVAVNIRTMPEKRFLAGVRDVKNIILVGSGKGGVGKSTTAVNLAVALATLGAKVGLLDGDVYGPNVPRMMGLPYGLGPRARGETLLPMEAYGVKVFSMGFFVREGEPLIWRGPLLHGMIQQLLRDVAWGELDYLLVDLPPGTGDVQLSLTQLASIAGGVIVSTPQAVAWADAYKAAAMLLKMEVPILGFIENMSPFRCPGCGHEAEIFGFGGTERAAREYGVPFLGRIPLDPCIREAGDKGKPLVVAEPDSEQARAFIDIAKSLLSSLNSTPT